DVQLLRLLLPRNTQRFVSNFTAACVLTTAGGSPLRGLRRRSSQLLIWAEIWLHGFWAALWFTWRCLAWGTCSLGRCGRDSFCCSFPLFVWAFFIRIFRGAAGRRMAQRPSAPKNKVWSVQRPASCPPPLR